MARTREELHEKFCEILGTRNCYYSPPPSIQMNYPCIVYHMTNYDILYASNIPYRKAKRFMVTVIDSDPDSLIKDRILEEIPYSTFDRDREYQSDNLNHFILTIFI